VPNNGRLREFKSFCREWLRGKRFDQMISENEDAAGVPRWVHIGYKNQDGRQRKQLLSKPAGETIYIPMTR
jgi:zinc D-Ala-D-Ala carboxypeptidase